MLAGYYNETGLSIRLRKVPWNKGLTKKVEF